MDKISLKDLGYNDRFEAARNQLGLGEFGVARVISEYKENYRVKDAEGEYLARITGKQLFRASSREDYPAVGDWVAIEKTDREHAVIRGILPRLTIIKRRFGDRDQRGEKSRIQVIAANIDVAFIVESVDRDYSLNRFERYLAIAEGGGVKPVLVLNKTDLLSDKDLEEKLQELRSRFGDADIVPVSVVKEDGLHPLGQYIEKGGTFCFLGSSGVGKSSIISKLIKSSELKTGEISSYSGRGRHVTTRRQMYFLSSNGILIDNPGMREVGIVDAEEGVNKVFEEIGAISEQCAYSDCTHVHEPECAVLAAVERGGLSREKYLNYINLKKEAEYYEADKQGRKEKEKKFGKFLKQAKKDLTNLRHKE